MGHLTPNDLSRFATLLETQAAALKVITHMAKRHPHEHEFTDALRAQRARVQVILDAPLAFTHK